MSKASGTASRRSAPSNWRRTTRCWAWLAAIAAAKDCGARVVQVGDVVEEMGELQADQVVGEEQVVAFALHFGEVDLFRFRIDFAAEAAHRLGEAVDVFALLGDELPEQRPRLGAPQQRQAQVERFDQGQLLADGDVEDLGVGGLFGGDLAPSPPPPSPPQPQPASERSAATSSAASASVAGGAGVPIGGSYCDPPRVCMNALIARRQFAGLLASAGGGDQLLPALPAAGRVARGARRRPAEALPGRGVLGAAAERLRRPRGAAGDRRPGACRPRRQPHRADVHRRPLGRLALRGAAPGGARQPGRSRSGAATACA